MITELPESAQRNGLTLEQYIALVEREKNMHDLEGAAP